MKTTTHILFLIAIFLVSMVAEPAYAATPKKGKGKTKKKARPELTRAGNTYYINGKEEIKGQKVLEFYAQQNCQAAYDQYKRGRQCYVAFRRRCCTDGCRFRLYHWRCSQYD